MPLVLFGRIITATESKLLQRVYFGNAVLPYILTIKRDIKHLIEALSKHMYNINAHKLWKCN